MAQEKKKSYIKPQVKTQKIELGVYGNYNGHEEVPTLPVSGKDETGGTNLAK